MYQLNKQLRIVENHISLCENNRAYTFAKLTGGSVKCVNIDSNHMSFVINQVQPDENDDFPSTSELKYTEEDAFNKFYNPKSPIYEALKLNSTKIQLNVEQLNSSQITILDDLSTGVFISDYC